MAQLQGKIALVTGSARGIGAGIAKAFLAEGAIIWISDIVDQAGQALADGQAAHRINTDGTFPGCNPPRPAGN